MSVVQPSPYAVEEGCGRIPECLSRTKEPDKFIRKTESLGLGMDSVLSAEGKGVRAVTSPTMDGLFYGERYHRAKCRVAAAATGKGIHSSWEEARGEMQTEVRFNSCAFCKTFWIELFPTCIAGAVVALCSGMNEAKNRDLFQLPIDIIIHGSVYFVTIATLVYQPDDVSAYDIGTLWAFLVCRSLTIATKYAFYGDTDLYDKEVGIQSKFYGSTGRLHRNLASEITFNMSGRQNAVLAEALYSSSVRRDVDLSFATVQFDSSEHAESVLMIVKIAMQDILHAEEDEKAQHHEEGKAKNKNGISRNTYQNREEIDEHLRSSELLTHHKFGRRKAQLHPYQLEESNVSIGGLQSAPSLAGLFAHLTRLHMTSIEKMAKCGKLPASIVAYHSLLLCYAIPKARGQRRFLVSVLVGLSVSFTPAVANLVMGLPAFGRSSISKAILIYGLFAFTFWFFIMWYYGYAPSVFYTQHLNVERYLHSMLAGKHDTHSFQPTSAQRKFWRAKILSSDIYADGVRGTAQKLSGNLWWQPPWLNMSIPENIVAFAAIRRVVHGGNFAPILQVRFNCYLFFSFGVVLIDAALHNFAIVFDEDHTVLASKFAATVRLLSMCVVFLWQLSVCHLLNRYTDFHSSEISRGRMSNLALAFHETDSARQATLMRAAFFLESLETAIRNDDAANPVRIMFLRAHIGVLSLLGSVLGVVLYFDLINLTRAYA